MKEYAGWLIAALMLIWHILSAEIMLRLDWVNFGNQYQQTQRALIEGIQSLSREVESVKNRVNVLQQQAPSAPLEKKQ